MFFKKDRSWPLIFHALCVVYGLGLLIWHPVVTFPFGEAGHLDLWRHGLLFMLRWPLVLLGVLLSTVVLTQNILLRRRIDRTPSVALSYTEAGMRRSWPVGLLPIAGILLLLGDILPPGITANAILFVPVLVMSLMLMSRVEVFLQQPVRYRGHEWTALILVASTIAYAALGMGLALFSDKRSPEHVGDEGHYLMQAESLWEDHDLDIRNNFLKSKNQLGGDFNDQIEYLDGRQELSPAEEDAHRSYTHISIRSLGDHWYSFHPQGLAFLLAPSFAFDGVPGQLIRYFILGLIAALGNVAMYKIARELGAGRNAALVTVAGFGLSIYWAIYSARALPEVLGATLLLWLFWCVLAQVREPRSTAWLGAGCLLCLPMAHERFLAPALMGFGFYGLFGLASPERWEHKFRRLFLFTLVSVAGLLAWWVWRMGLYEGGFNYDPESTTAAILFGYPLGMWGIIADWRGVVAMLPAFMWLAAAWIAFWLHARWRRETRNLRHADYALAIALTFVACLVTSCSNGSYVGGKCLPGRYILTVVPLLVPIAAVMFERVSISARWWYLCLCLVSTMLLAMVLIWLPEIGRGFIFPVTSLRDMHPALAGLFNPHVTFLYPEGGFGSLQGWATAYVLSGIGLTVVMMFTAHLRLAGPFAAGIVFLVGMAASQIQLQQPTTPEGFVRVAGVDGQFAKHLARVSMNHVDFKGSVTGASNLLDFASVTFRDVADIVDKISVTTKDLGARTVGRAVSQPRMENNDWDGRGYGWTTLTAPHDPNRGDHILRIRGEMSGSATAALAIREGSRTLMEVPLPVDDGKVDHHVHFNCSGWRGHLYILLRLDDGKGTFQLTDMAWLPFHESLVFQTGLHLPENLIRADRD